MNENRANKTLELIVGKVAKECRDQKITIIPLNKIGPSPFQARSVFDDKFIKELAASIHEIGVQQPIIVRRVDSEVPYQLIAGERRWRASILAGKATIPAMITDATDAESMIISITENMQRKSLNIWDTVTGVASLSNSLGSAKATAAKIGKSERSVERYLKVYRAIHSAPEFIELFQKQAAEVDLRSALTFSDLASEIRKLQKSDKREYVRIMARLQKKGIKEGLYSLIKKRREKSNEQAHNQQSEDVVNINETNRALVLTVRWKKDVPMTSQQAAGVREELENFLSTISLSGDTLNHTESNVINECEPELKLNKLGVNFNA